jgi:hypothetical protein
MMRNGRPGLHLVLVVAFAVSVAACGLPHATELAPAEFVAGVDFTPYTRLGFLFTPETFGGPYDAIGLIRVTRYAAGHYVVPEGATAAHEWQFDPVPVQGVVDSVFAKAKAMGANAVIRFQIDVAPERSADGASVPGITVSGFAIHIRSTP